jgi:ABC-type Mn2+/Zn2+ transport system permease subunit/Mn-dependent DtxR family transcriptional regulator
MPGRPVLPWWVFVLLASFSVEAEAAKVSDISPASIGEQAVRFFSMQDTSLRYALLGSILLGITCGVLGSFLVVRRLALVGDALSHAVLPGVTLGFLWNMTKDPAAIFIGAVISGLLGTFLVGCITRTTKIKEDAALGIVLASFFAVGLCLMSLIQHLPTGNKSGIEKFLFGQAAAISADDLRFMAIVTVITLGLVAALYKELLTSSFDPGFAASLGLPTKLLHHVLMFLLSAAVVVALQAVGVVLVSAMLITPAAAAFLLTDRMHRMVLLAAVFGLSAGVMGAFFSFLGNNLVTGPLMVLGASTVFAGAYFFGPRHGVIARWWRQYSRAARIQRENTLKAIYHVLERGEFTEEGVGVQSLAEHRRETLPEVEQQVRTLLHHDLATLNVLGDTVYLTPLGWQRASEIVRNHRLWELYLTNAAEIAPDHVHEDAEKIEHVLGEDVVRELERRLNHATLDPHGRNIPAIRDVHTRGRTAPRTVPSGYGGRT